MRKHIIFLFLLTASISSFSQNCEEREDKFLEAIGGFSGGGIYNTYLVIGLVWDGKSNYDTATVREILDEQKKLSDSWVKTLDKLKNGGYLKDKKDQDYAGTAINLLKDLKKQAQLIEDYTKNNSKQNQDAYMEQRNKNWSVLSKLLGMDE